MQNLRKDKILEYNDDTLVKVRRMVHIYDHGAMEDAVVILERWVQEQHHFTKKDFDRRYLETMLVASKGSIERAKTRLDRACTFRTLKHDLFINCDIRPFFKADLKHICHGVLPKMTKDHDRVYMFKNVGQKFELSVVRNFIRITPYFGEYLRLNDYAASYYVVLDYLEANLVDLVTKITLSDLQDIAGYALECCGFRLKALYFVSSSKVIEIGVAFAKQVLSTKLGERVHVVKSREAVKDFIEADILPKEYGGNEKSLEELHEDWLDVVTSKDFTEYFKEITSARTDESLRQRDSFNDQYLGMPGTFRMLSLD